MGAPCFVPGNWRLRPFFIEPTKLIPAALIAARTLQALLFGVQSTDAQVILAAAVILITASAAAAYLPAHRASKLDALTALRHE